MFDDHFHFCKCPQVDGDTSTNDCVIGLASGAAGTPLISDASSPEGKQLESALTALLQVGVGVLVGVCLCVGAGQEV